MIRRGLDRSPVSAGQRIHRVTVQTPTAPTPDGDGNYTQEYADATPASWMVEVRAASLRDLERYAAGTTITTASYLVSGPYRPDVTTAARLLHRGRALQLARVTNVDERSRELVCIALELIGSASAAIVIPPYQEQVVRDGAMAYWRLGETSGTIAADAIGSHHATISGGVTLNQSGAIADGNQAMAFDGSGKIQTNQPFAQVPPLTYEFWARWTDIYNAFAGMVFSGFPAGDETLISFGTSESPDHLRGYLMHGPGDAARSELGLTAAQPVNDGQWHHLVWIFSGGLAFTGYVDGVVASTTGTISKAVTGSSRRIEMGYSSVFGNSLTGALDEVAIYPLALTATQVADHYAARLLTSTRSPLRLTWSND